MSTREIEGGVTIDLLVQPRASRNRFGPRHGDRIKVSVTCPPVDGAANEAVIDLVSKTFARSRSEVEVVRGHSSRRKTLRVMGIAAALVEEHLQ